MFIHKKIAFTGAVMAFLAVLLGAFAAHGLKAYATPEIIESFKTGVRYQMYHALALLFLSLISDNQKGVKRACYFFVAGIILFSGSIYALTVASVLEGSLGLFAIITPIGGLCLLFGWILLGFLLLKTSKSKSK